MNIIQSSWTPARDLYLTENRASKSAAEIGLHLGVTRNAVLGRANRLGLPKLPRSGGRRKTCRPLVVPRKVDPGPEPLNIPFLNLAAGHCRQIVGSEGVGQSLSCGHPIARESYCRFHYSKNYFRPRR